MIDDKHLEMILDISVGISVEVGTANLTIGEILNWKPGMVVPLNRYPDEPVDVFVNDIPLATGEVVEMDSRYGVRIVDVATPQERIKTLG